MKGLLSYKNCGATSVGAYNRVITGQFSIIDNQEFVGQSVHNQEDNERNLQDIRKNYSQMSRRIFRTMLK